MKTENRVPLVFILLIAVVFVLAAFDARAGGDKITQSNDMNNQTAGNVDASSSPTIGGDSNRSYALGMAGLGDVDINEGRNCMGTEAFSITVVAKQDMKLNPWCAALFYDANGKHEMAARARCLLSEILSMSGDDKVQCIADNTMEPQLKKEAIENILPDHDDEDYEQLRGELQAVMTELKALQDEKKKALARVAHAEKVAQRAANAPQTVQYGITDEQRAELAEVFSK